MKRVTDEALQDNGAHCPTVSALRWLLDIKMADVQTKAEFVHWLIEKPEHLEAHVAIVGVALELEKMMTSEALQRWAEKGDGATCVSCHQDD